MVKGLAIPVTNAEKHKKKTPVRWKFDKRTGNLSFFGDGPIPDYTESAPPPWDTFKQKIKHLEVCRGITRIGGQNFSGCTALSEVTLADTVSSIGYEAFAGCTALQRIDTPRPWAHAYEKAYRARQMPEDDGTLRVSMRVFEGSPWQSALFGEYCIADNVLIEYYGSDEEITIPDAVQEIGSMAFEGRPIRHVTFPRTVRVIHTCAFRSTRLEELILPTGVEEIGPYAFSGIPTLQYVMIRNRKLEAAENAFADTPVYACSHRKNGKWASLYTLNQKEEIGTDGIRRLEGGRNEKMPMGVSTFYPKTHLLQMIRSGAIILRIRLDRERKEVDYVQAFAEHPYYGLFSYTQYPCVHEGVWEPYSEDTASIESQDILRCSKEGLWPVKKNSSYVWYTVPYSREAEYWAAFAVWTQWLRDHPDYSVPTADERYRSLIRNFPPC